VEFVWRKTQICLIRMGEARGSVMVKALCYKAEGHGVRDPMRSMNFPIFNF
jgi:hypothetical protein